MSFVTYMKIWVKLLLDIRWDVLRGEEKIQLIVGREWHYYWLCFDKKRLGVASESGGVKAKKK